MDALSGSALVFSVLVGAMMVGGLLQYLGILPQLGYLLSGYFIMPALPGSVQSFLFASGVALLIYYLGYVASSRRLFSTPFQTVFVQPLRIVIGFSMFFILFYVAGEGVAASAALALLFSTSSALILRWGVNFAHRRIEESLVAMDAAVSAIVLLYILGTSGWSLLLAVALYVAFFFVSSAIWDTLLVLLATALWYVGSLPSLALLFLLGVFTHHRIHGAGKRWLDPIMHDVVPLYFLFVIAGAAQYPFSVSAALMFLGILVVSFLQNFVALVVMGPLFGIPPKIGAHMTARAFGPSEAALAAALFLHSPVIAVAALWFYAFALFVYSFVKTDVDAERFVSAILPKAIVSMLERFEAGYMPIYVKNRVLLDPSFAKAAKPQARSIITAILASLAAILLMMDALTVVHKHSVLYILFAVFVVILAAWVAIPAYLSLYWRAMDFLSKYSYDRPLRPGRAPHYFVGGYLAVLVGFALLPLTLPTVNLVIIFFALLLLNLGLYVLLNNYYRIVGEFLRHRTA